MRWILWMLVIGMISLWVHAEDVTPATQPAADEQRIMSDLVKELANDNPKIRSQAAVILQKHGKDALNALALGAQAEDVQIRTSSQALIDRIKNPEKYRAPEPMNDLALQQRRVIRVLQPGIMRFGAVELRADEVQIVHAREMKIVENGLQVTIHEDVNGISVAETVGGQTTRYEAKNADELKQKSPEGFKLYQRYANMGH